MSELTFTQTLKKLELSLRSNMTHESIKYLSMLSEKATTDEEKNVVEDIGEAISTASADELESTIENAYNRV